MHYQIFCKYQQEWNEYEVRDDEFHGGDYGLILGCHLCNNYWIVIDHKDGIRDGVRDGYDKYIPKKILNDKPKFSFTQKPSLYPKYGAKEWVMT